MNLYNYTNINTYSKNNLMNNQIYFQSPKSFNDPYEFIFKIEVKDKIYVDFLKLIYGDKYIEFVNKRLTKEEVLAYTRDFYFVELWKSLGAACFTENENDDVMWAHYGGNHKGICIEYDRTRHPFNLCEQVKYVEEVFNMEIEDLFDFEREIPRIFNEVLLRKNKVWDYENEWRL